MTSIVRGKYTANVIYTAYHIVDSLIGAETGLTLDELAESLNRSTSTIRRYTIAAQDLDIIERVDYPFEGPSRYRLLNERLRKAR